MEKPPGEIRAAFFGPDHSPFALIFKNVVCIDTFALERETGNAN